MKPWLICISSMCNSLLISSKRVYTRAQIPLCPSQKVEKNIYNKQTRILVVELPKQIQVHIQLKFHNQCLNSSFIHEFIYHLSFFIYFGYLGMHIDQCHFCRLEQGTYIRQKLVISFLMTMYINVTNYQTSYATKSHSRTNSNHVMYSNMKDLLFIMLDLTTLSQAIEQVV